jgi:serine/threonine-protein kinase RsbW
MHRSHFQISATQSELQRITGMVEAFCAANKLPEPISNHMKLALDEVLSNIVKYAYGATENGIIDVELTYADNKFMATVEDRGVAFDPLRSQGQIARGPLKTRKEGGLGIFFVKSLMDGVGYERNGDRNKVTLTIEVPSV